MADNSKFVPPKGMRDWLPQETLLRQKLIKLIESHYQLYGFQPIDTPVMENIEVLQGKGGGENEKLMFKVMKRGEELSEIIEKMNHHLIDLSKNVSATLTDEDFKRLKSVKVSDLEKNLLHKSEGVTSANDPQSHEQFKNQIPDMGLRFDLTVPLARYIGNHFNDLPKPFRCYHIGPVWRADRPQKGRFREFYQCDIDIVGSSSDHCEVELLLATDRVLKELKVGKFKIRVSHKLFLSKLLGGLGVNASQFHQVAIAIDKLDKQPLDNVLKEISETGVSKDVLVNIETFVNAVKAGEWNSEKVSAEANLYVGEISAIVDKVKQINPEANLIMDPLLVRGFDYYTGPVFEINVEDKDFSFSIGGGGRYDGLIEKLGGPKNTPAVGISLGFERILLLLMEKKKSSTNDSCSKVFVTYQHYHMQDVFAFAELLRSKGVAVEMALEDKKMGQQLEMAQKNGIEYAITGFTPGISTFKVRQLSNRQDTEMTAEQLKAALHNLSS